MQTDSAFQLKRLWIVLKTWGSVSFAPKWPIEMSFRGKLLTFFRIRVHFRPRTFLLLPSFCSSTYKTNICTHVYLTSVCTNKVIMTCCMFLRSNFETNQFLCWMQWDLTEEQSVKKTSKVEQQKKHKKWFWYSATLVPTLHLPGHPKLNKAKWWTTCQKQTPIVLYCWAESWINWLSEQIDTPPVIPDYKNN